MAPACFHGAMAYRPFARHVLGLDLRTVTRGPQSAKLADARVYLAPNPSPANAANAASAFGKSAQGAPAQATPQQATAPGTAQGTKK